MLSPFSGDIVSIVSCVPGKIEHNENLSSGSESEINRIIKSIGIRHRRIVDEGVTAADLCLKAAKKAIELAGISNEEIGVLIFVTQYPDYLIPATAHQLQDQLGLNSDTLCIQVNQGCSGYVYGLSLVSALLEKNHREYGLLMVGDTTSKVINENDLQVKPIFGDAGSATILRKSDKKIWMTFGTDGSHWKDIYLPNSGFKESLHEKPHLHMNGLNVFTFSINTVYHHIKDFVNTLQLTIDMVDFLVLHQANQLMNDRIALKLGFDKDKSLSSLENFGNTSNASIPVTICNHFSKNKLEKEVSIIMSGFGTGLSWGSAFTSISPTCKIAMIDY